MRFTVKSMLVLALSAGLALPATAEVRIGKGVRIGGHTVAPQTFDENRRGEYIITPDGPDTPRCRWRKNTDGSKTKVCRMKRKKN